MKEYCPWIMSLLLLTVNTQAIGTAISVNPFCRFYAGGAVGGSFSSARTNTVTNVLVDHNALINTNNSFNNSIAHIIKHGQRKNTLALSVYTGYAYVWEDAYLGLEGLLNTSGYRVQTKHAFTAIAANEIARLSSFNASIKNTTLIKTRLSPIEPAVDIRPGLFLTPCTLLYGRIGVAYNKASVQAIHNTSISIAASPNTLLIEDNAKNHFTKHKKVSALRLGFGIEQILCDNLSIRADYVNTNYRGVKVVTKPKIKTTTNANGDTTLFRTNVVTQVTSLFKNTVLLGLSYYW